MHRNTTLLSPSRFCLFLTIRRLSFLISSVKIVILSTIIFTYKLGQPYPRDSPPQSTSLPYPQRYRTIFMEAVCRSPGSAHHSLCSWLSGSQQCQDALQQQVVEPTQRDTKEGDDNQYTPFSATMGE